MNRIFRFKLINQISSRRNVSTNTDGPVMVNFVDGIKTITMCDTRMRNALSISMMEKLIRDLSDDIGNPSLRVIVIGALGNVFSAGHNLKELSSDNDKEDHREVFRVASKLMSTIRGAPIPVIAKVNGIAAAAGCQLVAQCDLAICSSKSTFATPGVKIGIFCSTPAVALTRCVPKSTSMKMLLTGKPISAQEAKQCGLVADVCEEDELDTLVENYCHEVKSKSREVIELGKSFYYHQLNLGTETAFEEGAEVMVRNLELQDGKEGVTSFIQKRKPNWTHGM